jgi:DNA-directed RNA polymerase specialized sigma24 family protein
MFWQWVLIGSVIILLFMIIKLKRRVFRLESRLHEETDWRDQMTISLTQHIEELDQHADGLLRKVSEREKALLTLMSHVDNLLPILLGKAESPGNGSESTTEGDQQVVEESSISSEPSNYREKAVSVLTLAEEGLSAGEIAKRLGIGCGEVRMILNMKRLTKA